MKKLLLIILVLCLSSLFISCKDSNSTKDSNKTLKEVTFTKDNWYEYLSVSYTTEKVGDYYNYKYTVSSTSSKYTFKNVKVRIFLDKYYNIPSSGNTTFNVRIKTTDNANNYTQPTVTGKVSFYE